MCKENANHEKQEESMASPFIYLIKDVPDNEYMQMHELEKLAIPIEICSICSKSTRYPDIDDAFQHLQQFHSQKRVVLSLEDRQRLGHWLVSTASVELGRRNAGMISLIEAVHWRTKKLLYKAMEIRSGVANEEKEKPSHYLLPSALVKAAEKTFKFIFTSLHAVRFLKDQISTAAPNLKTSPVELRDNIALAEYYAIAAKNALSKAQDELLLMAYTGSSDGASIVQYISIPPETTALYAIGCLVARPIVEELRIQELYRNHLSSLVSTGFNI